MILNGRIVDKQRTISMGKLAEGFYLVRLSNNDKSAVNEGCFVKTYVEDNARITEIAFSKDTLDALVEIYLEEKNNDPDNP
jgi:hypothetical protein